MAIQVTYVHECDIHHLAHSQGIFPFFIVIIIKTSVAGLSLKKKFIVDIRNPTSKARGSIVRSTVFLKQFNFPVSSTL